MSYWEQMKKGECLLSAMKKKGPTLGPPGSEG